MGLTLCARWTNTRNATTGENRRPARLHLEVLEARLLPSLTPHLLKDIHLGSASSSPAEFTAVGPTAYFVANDGVHGYELWKSNGTAAGTVMVKDINLGSGSGVSYYAADLTNVNGMLFFLGNDGRHGTELWKTNGSAVGTVPVFSSAQFLTNVNGTLFFQGKDAAHGPELWKSNGTIAGTVLVKDIFPGSAGSDPSYLTNVNGTLFFAANDGVHNVELWKSNGTAAGTIMVKDILPGSVGSFPDELTNFKGTLFFQANDGVHGWQLWKSNGTAAGTVMVADIFPGTFVPYIKSPTNVNGTLFFGAANRITRGLWKSNGTGAGTTLVKALTQFPYDLTAVDSRLFFQDNGKLWVSNGTATGTFIIPINGSSEAGDFTNVNGSLFFLADAPFPGTDLWQSNGTVAGTVLVKGINPDNGISSSKYLTNINGTLFFSANDGVHGQEPWILGPVPPVFVPSSLVSGSEAAFPLDTGTAGPVATLAEQRSSAAQSADNSGAKRQLLDDSQSMGAPSIKSARRSPAVLGPKSQHLPGDLWSEGPAREPFVLSKDA